MTKSANKTARPGPPGKPFAKGGDPRQGRGPKPGAPNAGRTPDWFKAKMGELATRKEVLDYIEEHLVGKNGDKNTRNAETFYKALDRVLERWIGKATQKQEIAGPGGEPLPATVRVELIRAPVD